MRSKQTVSIIAVKLVLTVIQARKDATIKDVLVARSVNARSSIKKRSKNRRDRGLKQGEQESYLDLMLSNLSIFARF